MKFLSFALVLLLALAGCRALSTAPDSPQVRIEVESATFRLDPSVGAVAVPFSVRNIGEETVYLARCGDSVSAELERWEGGEWVNAAAAICLAIYDMSPLPLGAGEMRRSAHGVHKPGRYRLRIGASGSPGERSTWGLVSEPFIVE